MKIAIGSDHAGYAAKQVALAWLERKQFTVNDLGTYSEESTDYLEYAHAVAEWVSKGKAELGVLICGSANGVAMTANKHASVRAAICWLPEIAALARQHNDANICCLPARFLSEKELESILDAFFNAAFEGGRHARRVEKISCS
jgi:ribose 5-phosphate isomerase B